MPLILNEGIVTAQAVYRRHPPPSGAWAGAAPETL